ncbi:MAG: ABC transporter ATP-binding protein, partial [Deltaproteobacteria bacterium]|nr:ABC transporter ATP-binding protein [Deltaproteobacteria bacterium]
GLRLYSHGGSDVLSERAVSGWKIFWRCSHPEKYMIAQVFEKKDASVLEARKITVRFEGLEALSRLSFSIDPRRIVSIIGPNGAGKTTLLNAITGIYPLHAGEILFQGKPIAGLKPFQIAAMGITRSFQQAQLFMNMTVLENVMVGMHSRTRSGFIKGMLRLPSSKRTVIFRASRTEASFFSKTCAIMYFSGWLQRQKIFQPEILLLDEPAAGLTIREMEEMGNLILGLKEKGQTIILVEHNMRLVMAISDSLIVLHHGIKIGEGRPDDIQKNQQVIEAYLGK